ncbi:hypothetical protein L249_3656, partial [Ophiocordyceps polyrhachis-furcata BCC 54312]
KDQHDPPDDETARANFFKERSERTLCLNRKIHAPRNGMKPVYPCGQNYHSNRTRSGLLDSGGILNKDVRAVSTAIARFTLGESHASQAPANLLS